MENLKQKLTSKLIKNPKKKTFMNTDLHELTDPAIVDEVIENINLIFKENDEIAPVIVGTIVQD